MNEQEYEEIRAEMARRGAIRGWIKVQNILLPFGRHVIPQLLYIEERAWRPTMLVVAIVNGDETGFQMVRLSFDVRANAPVSVSVFGEYDKRVRSFPDGSALYECWVEDTENLPADAAICHQGFRLRLFHHTAADSIPLIAKSGHLRASRCNYLGSTELKDRHFIYFTDWPEFKSNAELQAVAMTDGGFRIGMQYDIPNVAPEVMEVPKRDRAEMDARIDVVVEPWLLEQPPLLYHDSSVAGEGVTRYWEICHPHIFRIPVRPGTVCELREDRIVDSSAVAGWQRSDRVLAGCAFELGAIRTVFDEVPLADLPINMGLIDGEECPFNRFLRAK